MGNGFVIYKHPEMKDNEWHVCNVKQGEEWLFGFFNDRRKNHRLGKIAYDNMGYPVNNSRPVFVKNKDRIMEVWNDNG